jgi:histone H3/H4
MVALTIEFIGKAHLLNYQIKSAKYDPVGNRFEFKLTNYFSNMPDLEVRIMYFELLKEAMVMVHTTDMMYRVTTSAQDHLEKMLEKIATEIRENLKEESEHAEKSDRVFISDPL